MFRRSFTRFAKFHLMWFYSTSEGRFYPCLHLFDLEYIQNGFRSLLCLSPSPIHTFMFRSPSLQTTLNIECWKKQKLKQSPAHPTPLHPCCYARRTHLQMHAGSVNHSTAHLFRQTRPVARLPCSIPPTPYVSRVGWLMSALGCTVGVWAGFSTRPGA